MQESFKYSALVVMVAVLAAACDKVPLLAPRDSTIALSANSLVVPTNGTTGLTAFVTESSGTPVQNGTTVRFTTTLGTVTPAETQTTNGLAVATFQAGTSSGIAEVHAISGGATGSTSGTGTTATTTNVVKITIGAAAVNTVTLRANPSTVGPTGGAVELIATVITDSGSPVLNVPVTFNSDQGVLSVQTVPTDAKGEARTVLTTAQKASVTATAGTKTSSAVTVDVRVGPGVSITCAPSTTAQGTTCASITPGTGNSATVIFTIKKGSGTSNLRDVVVDFGDRTSQSVGNLAGGDGTVTHNYAGPSGSGPNAYTATARATDVNGEVASASTTVVVNPRTPLSVTITATKGTEAGGKVSYSLEAKVTGSTDIVEYAWDFGDDQTATTSGSTIQHIYTTGSGIKTVKVTAKITDGRTVDGQTQINP